MLTALIAATALQAAAAAAHASPARPPPALAGAAGPLSFDGAQLGMTVGEWKALAPPPGVGPTAAADCGPGIAAALREAGVSAATPAAGHAICAYDARFGSDVLLHSAMLDNHDHIDDLRYRFAGGRLAEVDFTASIDAYNDIEARLTRKYGPPTATVRDVMRTSAGRFPRVRQTWRSAGGVVTLDDPTSSDPLRLAVRIGGPGAGR